jgi:predicted acylesterase/phospholipase RssA
MEKTIGFALGGGGAKAYAELGAMRELEKLGIMPNYLAGTSMGAVNAVLYAAGYSVDEIINFFSETPKLDMFAFDFSKGGIISNEGLGTLVENMCKQKNVFGIEDLPLPTYITATDDKTEMPIIMKTGGIKQAIMITTATIYFHKVKLEDGTVLKDGGYKKNVPFDVLDELRKDKSIDGEHFDVAFDVYPNYQPSLLCGVNKMLKIVLKRDRARKQIFLDEDRGIYLDMETPFFQASFKRSNVEKGIEIGKKCVVDYFKNDNAKKYINSIC